MPNSSLRIHSRSNASSRPVSFHRRRMNVAYTHIFLYLSTTPQHAVVGNSAMFFRAREGYDKDPSMWYAQFQLL